MERDRLFYPFFFEVYFESIALFPPVLSRRKETEGYVGLSYFLFHLYQPKRLTMNKILVFSFSTFLAFSSFAQSSKYRLDSLVYYAQDSLGNNYRSTKNAYTYDAKGNCTEDLNSYLNQSTGKWSLGSKTLYYFDNKGNDTMTYSTSWSEEQNNWIYYQKYIETYDNQNRRTSYTQHNMDQASGNWIRVWRRDYTYDASNRPLSIVYQDSMGASLKYSYKEEFEYTSIVNNKYQYNWSNNQWRLTAKEESLLDNNGDAYRVTTYYLKYGTEANPEWDNSSKYEHTYNSTHDRTGTYSYNWQPKTWLGNDYQWIPTSYVIFTNDAFHNLIDWENKAWNKTKEVYESQYKVERSYNTAVSYQNLLIPRSFSNDNLPSVDFRYMLQEDRFLGYVNGTWKLYAPNKYYYSPMILTGIETLANISQKRAYPNPMCDVLYVDGKAELIDLWGNKMIEGEDLLEVSQLSKGVYIVKTSSGAEKLIKE